MVSRNLTKPSSKIVLMFIFIKKMINKLDETFHDNEAQSLFCKASGFNNHKAYVLRNNRFNTRMVLIFSDLNETQFYKMPYRESPPHEIEILMSSNYLNLFTPNEHTEDYHITKPSDKNFFPNLKMKNLFIWEKN